MSLTTKQKAWYSALIGFLLIAGSITYYGMAQSTAKSLLLRSCNYWETKGQLHWCSPDEITSISLTKCAKQVYLVKTNNNPCSDLIITGGGGKAFRTYFVKDRITFAQENCGVQYYEMCK